MIFIRNISRAYLQYKSVKHVHEYRYGIPGFRTETQSAVPRTVYVLVGIIKLSGAAKQEINADIVLN